MDLSVLLEEALADRGNAVMLLARPHDGENAVIQAGNGPFARILGWHPNHVAGQRLKELRPFVERPEDWTTLIAAVRSLAALTLDLRLRVKGREVWLGFSLTFKVSAASGDSYGIMIGRDITEARERNIRESESQRLLASVFLRIAAAVAIIDGEGVILMANPACQQLLRYGPGELTGKHVEDMIAPAYSEATRAARARQLGGAGDYVLPIAVLAKDGEPLPVTLHSTLLRDARDRQLRVVTLIPGSMPHNPLPSKTPEEPGQVREVSLAALKMAYGKKWPLIADRAMLTAEQILKRYLGVSDALWRRNDHSYLIWFAATNNARNAGVLAAATQELRQRLLEDGNDVTPGSVDAVSIGAEAIPDGAVHSPVILSDDMDLELEEDERPPPDRDPDALMRYLRARVVANVEIVTGRDGVARPNVLVDFEPVVRGCLYHLVPSLSREPDFGARFDLIRLNLAVQTLAGQQAETKVLVPISWPAVADPDCRRLLDRRLAQIEQSLRSRIVLAVSGVPRLLSKPRWSEVVGSFQHQLDDVGLLLTHRDGELEALESAITSEWPLSLLIIDRTEGPPVVIQEYRHLFAAARRRDISVLVRTTARNDISEWRKLGATMFTTTN